jgi:hypothetical protein
MSFRNREFRTYPAGKLEKLQSDYRAIQALVDKAVRRSYVELARQMGLSLAQRSLSSSMVAGGGSSGGDVDSSLTELPVSPETTWSSFRYVQGRSSFSNPDFWMFGG